MDRRWCVVKKKQKRGRTRQVSQSALFRQAKEKGKVRPGCRQPYLAEGARAAVRVEKGIRGL